MRQVEPQNGVFYEDRPQALQFSRGGADSLRAYARREGFLVLNGLNYRDGWLGGDWVGRPTHFLYSYDRFYGYCLRILDLFSGKGELSISFGTSQIPSGGREVPLPSNISPWSKSTSGA